MGLKDKLKKTISYFRRNDKTPLDEKIRSLMEQVFYQDNLKHMDEMEMALIGLRKANLQNKTIRVYLGERYMKPRVRAKAERLIMKMIEQDTKHIYKQVRDATQSDFDVDEFIYPSVQYDVSFETVGSLNDQIELDAFIDEILDLEKVDHIIILGDEVYKQLSHSVQPKLTILRPLVEDGTLYGERFTYSVQYGRYIKLAVKVRNRRRREINVVF